MLLPRVTGPLCKRICIGFIPTDRDCMLMRVWGAGMNARQREKVVDWIEMNWIRLRVLKQATLCKVANYLKNDTTRSDIDRKSVV